MPDLWNASGALTSATSSKLVIVDTPEGKPPASLRSSRKSSESPSSGAFGPTNRSCSHAASIAAMPIVAISLRSKRITVPISLACAGRS